MNEPTPGAREADPLPAPAPVAKDDPGLAELREMARKQGRLLRWSAVGLALVAVAVPPVFLLADPVQTGQALGYTQQVVARVDAVRLSDSQPRKQRNRPAWTVWVSWATSDGVREGTDDVRSPEEPFVVGEEVTTHVLGDDREVSLRSTGDVRAVGAIVLAFAAAIAAASVGAWRRSRRWPRRVEVVTQVLPERIRVRGIGSDTGRGTCSRQDGTMVRYRPVARATGGGDFFLDGTQDGGSEGLLPEEGDLLDVWSLPQNHRGPFAVRRVSDGRWWTGRGPDPVPSVPAR